MNKIKWNKNTKCFTENDFTYLDLYNAIKYLFPNYHIKQVYGLDKTLYIERSSSSNSYKLPYQISDALSRKGLISKNESLTKYVQIGSILDIPKDAIKLQ